MSRRSASGSTSIRFSKEAFVEIGNLLRITPQLISTADGYHLWSQTFERDADNLFGVQDEISRLVVQALGPSSVTVDTRRAPNPKAYRLSLQARYHWNKWNPNDIKRSIALLDEALAIDPAVRARLCVAG